MVFVFLVKLNYDSIYELDIKLHAFVTIWEFLCQVDERGVDFNKVKFGFEAQGHSLFLTFVPALRFTSCPLRSGLNTLGCGTEKPA